MIKFFVNLFESIAFFFKLVFKLFKFVLMLTGVLSFARCGGSGYKKEGGKVFFDGKEVGKDFVVLNDEFAKNDSAAYYKSYSIDGADIATFTALSKHYAKDKSSVFYCDTYRESQNYYLTKRSTIFHIPDADPVSFIMLGDEYSPYAKDDKSAYLNGTGFPVKDVGSLELISGWFIKDKYQVYHGQKPVKGSDPGSFIILDQFFAKDNKQAYYYTFPSEGGVIPIVCNSASFTLLEYPYSKDANSVFYIDAIMDGVDASTFSILGSAYSKDKNLVYHNDKKLSGADAASFMVLAKDEAMSEDDHYGKDKAGIYWKDKKFGLADPGSFKVLGNGYTVDDRQVFYNTKVVKDADPVSFKVYPHFFGNADAEDKNRKYGEGKKVSE